ncbi:hypothetical protein [Rhizobium straminoryzae]|uniref:Uncharacterized protein n=1 Tax=Rhizobium straminoryzae TaxID=1387186 RepID=A0A549SRM5_9HYPH|nr:hypothetical protein [Rhizobium straminoryzae]TRL32261.1 hypothetical protein FNA46_23650 [Rhizobium straminoryzae]
MVFRLIEQLRNRSDLAEPTGTYPDGAFPAMRSVGLANEHPRLRKSYERDLAAARRLADMVPVFH